MKFFKLCQTGFEVPLLGLGTWQAKDAAEVENAVYNALEIGYKHIDTAFNYENEEAIGNAIKKWIKDGKGNREELFVTTKLPHIGNRGSDVKKFLNMSLKRLQLSYIDLYLIHVPFGFIENPETLTPKVRDNGEYELDIATDHRQIWRAMENMVEEKLVLNIGLSNFNQKQVEDVWQSATIKPQVLQVECHAQMQQQELRSFCDAKSILVTAYSPLGSPGAKEHFTNKYGYSPDVFPDLIHHPVITDLSAKHNRSPAQILLRYLLQLNIAVIPKSTNIDRLKENFDLFSWELTIPDMDSIKGLDRGERGRIIDFLFWKGVDKHPHYPFMK